MWIPPSSPPFSLCSPLKLVKTNHTGAHYAETMTETLLNLVKSFCE